MDDLEQRVERKIDKKLLEKSDSGELDREAVKQEIISELKEEQAGQRQGWLETMDTDSVSRRSFLKMLGLGTGGLALASSASADFGQVLASTQGTSDINADTVDGKDASDLGSALANPSSVQTASKQASASSDFPDNLSDSDSATISLSGPGWVLSGTYSIVSGGGNQTIDVNTSITANVDGNKYFDNTAINRTRFIPALYFNSSLVIDMNCSTSVSDKGESASADVSATVNYINT